MILRKLSILLLLLSSFRVFGQTWISNVSAVPGSTTAVITWNTAVPATAKVKYGLSSAYGKLSVTDSSARLSHSITLTGLTVSSTYHFRPISKDSDAISVNGKDYTFTTTGNAVSGFRFTSWADTKSGTAVLASLSRQAKPLNSAFTIYAGDLESAGSTTTGLNSWKAALNGNVDNGTFDRSFSVRGNHDASNSSTWQNYFNFAGVASAIGTTNYSVFTLNQTYSFDYSNAHFVGIDDVGAAPLITAGQINWLDADLAAAEARGLTHAFIFFHGPLYCVETVHCSCTTRTCATNSTVASIIAVLNNHPIVSAIFNGHEHVLAYVQVDSTRIPSATHQWEQFVIGTAGAELYECDLGARTDWCAAKPGFATIDVAGPTFAVNVFAQGTTTPVKTWSFTK